jgi:hypothetical protein
MARTQCRQIEKIKDKRKNEEAIYKSLLRFLWLLNPSSFCAKIKKSPVHGALRSFFKKKQFPVLAPPR